jgi:hypothetical protein
MPRLPRQSSARYGDGGKRLDLGSRRLNERPTRSRQILWDRTDAERCPICAEVVERIREQLATGAGVGILKTAKALGVDTGTVHRVKRSTAAVAV